MTLCISKASWSSMGTKRDKGPYKLYFAFCKGILVCHIQPCLKDLSPDKTAHLKSCFFFLKHSRISFLAYRTGISMNPTGARNVILHEGSKTTPVYDVTMTILTSFLTSWHHFHRFPPNVSTSTFKRGDVLKFSWFNKCSYFSDAKQLSSWQNFQSAPNNH